MHIKDKYLKYLRAGIKATNEKSRKQQKIRESCALYIKLIVRHYFSLFSYLLFAPLYVFYYPQLSLQLYPLYKLYKCKGRAVIPHIQSSYWLRFFIQITMNFFLPYLEVPSPFSIYLIFFPETIVAFVRALYQKPSNSYKRRNCELDEHVSIVIHISYKYYISYWIMLSFHNIRTYFFLLFFQRNISFKITI